MNQAENENVRKKIKIFLTNEVRKTRIEFIKSKNRCGREVSFKRICREQQVVGLLYGVDN